MSDYVDRKNAGPLPALDIVLHCEGVSHAFGPKPVLHDVNLEIVRGQFVSLVGPSGCGKSTLLRAIVGTHPPTGGRVVMHSVNGRGTYDIDGPCRDRGIIYQRYTLLPYLTALGNVAIGPKLAYTSIPYRTFRPLAWRRKRRQYRQEAEELLVRLGLQDALNRYPHELSGGMCQRVAIAQALIMKPEVLLMDEPFGALDEATREDLQKMMLGLYDQNLAAMAQGQPPLYTVVIVTHELNEALYVGDRVIGLSQYWNWAERGHKSCPGATVTYDDAAPIFSVSSVRDFELLTHIREDIRRTVFEPAAPWPAPKTGRNFWKRLTDGHVGGVVGLKVGGRLEATPADQDDRQEDYLEPQEATDANA